MIKYIYSIDRYVGKYFSFSPEQLSVADDLEKIWQTSQVSYSFNQLLEIFPEAKPAIKQNLLAEIRQLKQDIIKAEELRIKYNNTVLSKVKTENKLLYSLIRDVFFIEPLTEGREAKIKKNCFLISSLTPQSTDSTSRITERDIAHAKTIPIENYYSGKLKAQGHTLVGKCEFHTERSGSLTIYTQQNKFYCFGCQAGTDVIDFVQQQRGCTFLEAVKIILHK